MPGFVDLVQEVRGKFGGLFVRFDMAHFTTVSTLARRRPGTLPSTLEVRSWGPGCRSIQEMQTFRLLTTLAALHIALESIEFFLQPDDKVSTYQK